MKSAIIAGIVSLVVSLMVYIFKEQFNRLLLTWCLSIKPTKKHENYIRLRISNNYYSTIKKARLYLTIDHKEDDVLTPPENADAFIKPTAYSKLKDGRICWSFRTLDKKNPSEIDIFAKEEPDTNICHVQNDKIIISSEEGWNGTKRVFLKNRRYRGEIKIVSENTNAKRFKIEILPESMECLIY